MRVKRGDDCKSRMRGKEMKCSEHEVDKVKYIKVKRSRRTKITRLMNHKQVRPFQQVQPGHFFFQCNMNIKDIIS